MIRNSWCSFFRFVLMVSVMPFLVVGCSPDVEEEPEEMVVEEPELPPKPDWDDGTMTVTIGTYDDNAHLARVLKQAKNTTVHTRLLVAAADPNLVPLKKKTVEVAVVTLLEAGFTEPATKEEIRARYQYLGYRPLTAQEVIELRLQFKDQPGTKTGHRMSTFFVLLSEEDSERLFVDGDDGSMAIWRNTLRDVIGEGYGVGSLSHPKKINPHSPEITFPGGFRGKELRNTGTRFACVITK